MSDIERLVADRLRARRKEMGASQRTIAERMRQQGHDWHQTTVQRTESARRCLRLSEFASLAVALDTSMADLIALDAQTDSYARSAVRRFVTELRASVYAGDIPGSVIHGGNYEVKVHTTEQVQSWLRDRLGGAS